MGKAGTGMKCVKEGELIWKHMLNRNSISLMHDFHVCLVDEGSLHMDGGGSPQPVEGELPGCGLLPPHCVATMDPQATFFLLDT